MVDTGSRFPRGDSLPVSGAALWAQRWRAAVCGLAALLACAAVQAQDVPTRGQAMRVVMTATGPRTSPFEPPTKDIFLTDASPGLDTGCTFNTSPLNPLTIDIPIDRFVGDVDANGYLINPAPLVAAGLIPAAIDILMPAYDVDFNGAAPPERDEVLFNGQSLGFLTGDNNIWKLNTFRVDIRKVRFPARPAANSSPVPVNNRIQIRIDTLGVNRWCTSIDWVGLVLPIRPKLALDLDAVATNPVRTDDGSRLITKIQEQTFDANCNVSTTTSAIEQFPFSGPALTGSGGPGSAKLRARIKACPEGSLLSPAVKVDWSVDGTSRKGTDSFNGLQKDIELLMPAAIGRYTARLKLTVDTGDELVAERRLYVTRKAPLSAVSEPRLNWYRQATTWASGETAEPSIVTKVRAGLYGYGASNWQYGYVANSKCTWLGLMANPLSCGYSDCYVFSDVLENMSATLGVGGMVAKTVEGNYPSTFWRVLGWPGEPFLTTASPSLDPAFTGNARPVAGGAYDRYVFTSHSLRQRDGVYHDSTFNKAYAGPRDFIVANFTGETATDAIGEYRVSAEGPRLYDNFDPLRPEPYAAWGQDSYGLTAPRALPMAGARSPAPAGTATPLVAFPSVAAWRTPDANGDGRFDALEVDVNVDILTGGRYVVRGRLQTPSGELVSNTPAFQSSTLTRANFSGAPGRTTVTLRFSGEQIRYAGSDGPWVLVLHANGETGPAGTASLPTPAYRRADFGERRLQLRTLVPAPLDTDGSGRFDTVRLTAQLDVIEAGPYQLSAALLGGGNGLAARNRMVMLAAGPQVLTIDLPTTGIARSGIDGPYDITLNLSDGNQSNVGSLGSVLSGYFASQFDAVVAVAPALVEQLIDSNANGLADLLRVGVSATVRGTPRPAIVRGTIVAANGASVGTEAGATLPVGSGPTVNLDFSGPLLRAQQMSSAYSLLLSFRDPVSLEEFDALTVPLRGSYVYTAFDPAEPPRAIALNGARTDRGIDTNANGLFDTLQVDLGVDLLRASSCEWSARLVDRSGLELAFVASSGALPAGTGTVRLNFPGRGIGLNGLDGPYSIRSMLMACADGANLVATFAAETSAWRANQFEGYVVRPPGDLNGDGRVDSADITEFNRAFGSSVGDANYNRFADFDRDGRITLNDLRLFRRYLPR